jgi:integrase
MQPKFRAVLYRGAYYVAWRENGVIRRRALRTTNRDVAEQTLKSFVAQYEIANRPDNITVEYVWNGYWKSLGVKPAASTMRHEGKAVLPFFGTMAADAITEDDCRAYRAARLAAGRKDGTIWTELGRLRSALKWAEKRGLIGRAPSIERPPIQPPRDLRLTREQAKAFLDTCHLPHVRLVFTLAMTTGARVGAILGLTWSRVSFETGLIDLADPMLPKTKKGRAVVPMNATARAALSEARTGATTAFVIEWNGKPVKSVKKALKAAGARCALPWVTAHVFRHSAASWMAEAGVSMDKIAAFLGHSDPRITARVYAKFAPDYLRDAAEALEIDVMREVNGRTAK